MTDLELYEQVIAMRRAAQMARFQEMQSMTAESFQQLTEEKSKKAKRKSAIGARKSLLKKKYGLTQEQYDKIVETQKGKCPICKRDLAGAKTAVDHCHKTNVVRGILCSKCNLAEGLLGSIETARRMLLYMESNELFYATTP
jgi:DNA repair exonuclease SbcCD ATPase subunit